MSSEIYYVINTTNIAAKITTLEGKINIDPDITPTLSSSNYNGTTQILTLNFNSSLSSFEKNILNNLVKINIEEQPVSSFQPIPYNILQRQTYNSSSNPTVNFDLNSGFQSGSFLVNTSNQNVYMCIDNSANSAVWSNLTSSPVGGGGEIASTTTFSTSSNSYVVITGTNFTPSAGTYFVSFSALCENSDNSTGNFAFFIDNNIINDTLRTIRVNQQGNNNFISPVYTQKRITVNGSQTISVRCNINFGSISFDNFNINYFKV